jgi:hypothetical protein
MKQQVLVCFLVVVLVSLVNGLAIDLSKSIKDVETLLDNLRNLDTNMNQYDEVDYDTKRSSSCRDADDCGKNPGRPKEMCHVGDIKQHCPTMCGRKCGSEDKLDELISFLKNKVDYDDK